MEFLDIFLEEVDAESKLNVQKTYSKQDINYETEGSTVDENWNLGYPLPPLPQAASTDIFNKGCADINHMSISLDTSSTESCKTMCYSYINTPKVQETQASPRASKTVSKYDPPSDNSFLKESLEILSDLLVSSSEATPDDDINGAVASPNLNSCVDLAGPTQTISVPVTELAVAYSTANLVAPSQECEEILAPLPTPFIGAPPPPSHSDPDLYLGKVGTHLSSTPCSSDLVEFRASWGNYTKDERINKSHQFSTSSWQSGVPGSPETISTPLVGPNPLSSSLDLVSIGHQRNLPTISHYSDQIDFCFDSQLSPAPAPAPGQECASDQNNNKEDEPQMLKNDISNQVGLPLLTERSQTSYLKVLKSQEPVRSNASTVGLQQTHKTGFKTDLSKFYSSTPMAVVPAVQSGQNIIPAMVKNRRSTFFWNVEKHAWNKVKDDTLVNPNSEKRRNAVEYGGDIMLPPLERSKNSGVVKYGDNEKGRTSQRSKKRSNKRKKSIRMSDSVFRSEKRVADVQQYPESSGVLNNIRITSPLTAHRNKKTYRDHPIKINQRSFEIIDVKRTPTNLGGKNKVGNDESFVENDRPIEGGGDVYPSGPNILQMCWRCKSMLSSGSWHPHKWQKDKFLCSSCFSFFKKKGKKNTQQIREVFNNNEVSSSEAVADFVL